MPNPITPERRAEIAARCEEVYSNIGRLHPNVDKLLEADIPDLLSDNERLETMALADRANRIKAEADNERLAEDLRRVRGLLKLCEDADRGTCPICRGGWDTRHAPDCALDAELRAGG